MTQHRTLLLLCLLCWPLTQWVAAAPPESVSVLVEPGTNLRTLAERYLDDADAWPEILRANGLDAVDQLQPGTQLRIPVAASLELARALTELRQLIYRATAAGALVFADHMIEAALSNQAAAASARSAATLEEARQLAEQGIRAARSALTLSLANRDLAAQAVLDSAGGRVERRRPAELDWSAIAVDTLLAEEERLRTLSASFAVVRFRDASTLRMGEQAQLAIRRLREDRLTRREEVGVILYGGDVRALMGAGASRQTLSVTAEGVETAATSRDYWVQKTPETTRLANFDGELAITAEGSTVTLGRNQGTLVAPSKPPLDPVDLLEPPALLGPEDGAALFGIEAELRWSEVAGAAAYWVEVARDPEFTALVLSETHVMGMHFALGLGDEGLYYWRVASVDHSGLPGAAAPARHFQKTRDETPPYLLVRQPGAGLRTDDPALVVEGRTEVGASLSINGVAVPLGPDGEYRHTLQLTPGVNRVEFEVRDRAGNLRRLERVVHLRPQGELPLTLAPQTPRDAAGQLLASRPWLTLEGQAPPGSAVRVTTPKAAAFVAAGIADAAGRFGVMLHLDAPLTHFELSAEGPQGQRYQETFAVVLDRTPPRIRLDAEPPDRSAATRLSLSGQVEDGERLSLGDREVQLQAGGRFSLDLDLQPGVNDLTLIARDRAGNAVRWERSVVLDQEPPRLETYRLVDEQQGAQSVLLVEIEARDESGLVAAVPYRIEAGSLVREGIAQRCADRVCHRDRLVLPAGQARHARLSAVILQDYLGNRREVRLDGRED
ncbi:FecR domain-containing protein [Thiocystis violacea]|uniref:FecR domain-containing protein n=1 Tax=Thiocystis violacea TaxID=13725 RepID=UPI0019066167|nr:FecR domain-containing protein [Thiocystis violacea]MBK1720837.1 hypothetical protein [Thiocystis violacea]